MMEEMKFVVKFPGSSKKIGYVNYADLDNFVVLMLRFAKVKLKLVEYQGRKQIMPTNWYKTVNEVKEVIANFLEDRDVHSGMYGPTMYIEYDPEMDLINVLTGKVSENEIFRIEWEVL